MKDEVEFTYEDQPIKDDHSIDVGFLREEIKTINVWCHNKSKKMMDNIRLSTNLPKDAFSFRSPDTINPGSNVSIQITFDIDKVWDDDKIDRMAFKIDYDLIKLIQT